MRKVKAMRTYDFLNSPTDCVSLNVAEILVAFLWEKSFASEYETYILEKDISTSNLAIVVYRY